MAAVEQIVDLKDLPAGTPDPEDVFVYRDVSENSPETAYKKCTPAQAIIDDTTVSPAKAFSSDFIQKNTLQRKVVQNIDNTEGSWIAEFISFTSANGTFPVTSMWVQVEQYKYDDFVRQICTTYTVQGLREEYTRGAWCDGTLIENAVWSNWRRSVFSADKLALNDTLLSSNTVTVRNYSISRISNQNHITIAFSLNNNLNSNEIVTIGTVNILPFQIFQFAIPFLAGSQIGLGTIKTDGSITLQNLTGITIESWNTGVIDITYITA